MEDYIKIIIARKVLDKWKFSKDGSNFDETLFDQIKNFSTLDAFFEYLVSSKNMSLRFLPIYYQQNVLFNKRLLSKNPKLINEIYNFNFFVYQEILKLINPERFYKRCKFELIPQVKRDILLLMGKPNDEAMQQVLIKKKSGN